MIDDAWTPEKGNSAKAPAISLTNSKPNNYKDSDLWLRDASYVRLKNLTFGFTLPKTWTRKVGIDNIRLYASGNNLLTWAAYDYIDPESASSPSWDTPPMRTYTFGLEVKF